MKTKEKKLEKDIVFIEVNGIRTELSAKEFGNDSIIWKDGRVLDIERTERVRVRR